MPPDPTEGPSSGPAGLGFRLVRVGEDDRLTPLGEVLPSFCSPEVRVTHYSVSNVRLADDFQDFVGDLRIAGTVRSHVLDAVPGERGCLRWLGIDRDHLPEGATIPVDVSKAEGDGPLARPFAFAATFDETLRQVPVLLEYDTQLQVTEAIHGMLGAADWELWIDRTQPGNGPFDLEVTLLDEPGPGGRPGLRYRLAAFGDVETATLWRWGDGLIFVDNPRIAIENPHGISLDEYAIGLRFDDDPTGPGSTPGGGYRVIVDSERYNVGHLDLTLTRGPDGTFRGTGYVDDYAGERTPLVRHYTDLRIGEAEKRRERDAGEYHPFLVEFTGPREALGTLIVETGAGPRPLVEREGRFFLAAGAGDPASGARVTPPAVLHVWPWPPDGETEISLDFPEGLDPFERAVLQGCFLRGVSGAVEGNTEVIRFRREDGGYTAQVRVRTSDGDPFELRERLRPGVPGTVRALVRFAEEMFARDPGTHLTPGESFKDVEPPLHGEHLQAVAEESHAILDAIRDSLRDESAEVKGRVFGRILGRTSEAILEASARGLHRPRSRELIEWFMTAAPDLVEKELAHSSREVQDAFLATIRDEPGGPRGSLARLLSLMLA